RVFVLDHTRWTPQMKEAIDGLLQKHHGEKDILKVVDQEYAQIVHQAATDPNSMFHPTAKRHISGYVKHVAKLLNTSSAMNTSPEKLLDTQELWHSLTEGQPASVRVTTIQPDVFNPPAPASATPITAESLEKIVEGILQKQSQQSEQQQQKKKQTKRCLSCGQPKSRYETSGSSVHFFF
uniref:Uncharacterized protein n=2 Tax=Poecilia formosa TaxID=48698 RepID=A0A087YPT3_POEFO